jgi:hypothetical protein
MSELSMTADETWQARLAENRRNAEAAIANNRSKAEAAIKQRGTLSVSSLPTLQVFMCSHLSAQLTQWLSIAPCTAICYTGQQ